MREKGNSINTPELTPTPMGYTFFLNRMPVFLAAGRGDRLKHPAEKLTGGSAGFFGEVQRTQTISN